MKKFVIQAFQQKYDLSSKVKEKSATYLKNVHKIGKHFPTVKIMKKTNTRKQNQHLSSAQKFVISFVYNYIWKRISCSFVDLITPSIIKSNQLTKVTDYRSHVGFCQGTELMLKTIGETGQSTYSNYINTKEKISGFNNGNKFLKSSKNENSCKDSDECQLISDTPNGVKVCSSYLNENYNNKENLVLGASKQNNQLENVNSECVPENKIKNTKDHKKIYSSLSDPYLETNDSSLNDTQRNNYKEYNTVVVNSTLQSAKGVSGTERSNSVKMDKPVKIKYKNGRNINKYQSQKTSNNLPNNSKSNRDMDINSPVKVYPTLNSTKGNKSNKHKSSADRQRKNKAVDGKKVDGKTVVENNTSLEAENSLKDRSNRNNKLFVGLPQNDNKIDLQASSVDQKESLENVSETNLKHDNQQEYDYAFIKEDENTEDMTNKKSNILIQQEDGNRKHVVNESSDKRMPHKNTNENLNISKLQNKPSSVKKKLGKTNKAKRSKSSKSYKKKKRKESLQKMLLNHVKKDFQLNNKNLDNNENPSPEHHKEANQGHTDLTDDTIQTPEMVETNLIAFDTSQDDAQLLVKEESCGKKKDSYLIDLHKVLTNTNSHKVVSVKSHKKTNNPIGNNDINTSEIKPIKGDNKNLKPATITPWKKNKDLSADSRNGSKNQITNSNKSFDNGTCTSSPWKCDNNIDTQKRDVAENTSTNTSFSIPDPLSSNKINKKPLDKTLSLSNVHSKSKQERLSPKKTASLESPNLNVPLPTKNQMSQIKDKNISKHNDLSEEEKSGPKEKLNKRTVDNKATAVHVEKKTGSTSGSELNKNDKVISVKQNSNVVGKQVKGNHKDSTNSTKNVEYQNALSKTVTNKNLDLPLKESHASIVSSTHAPLSRSKKEKKPEKQTQFKNNGTSVASSKPKSGNLGKNLSTFSNNNTVLESLSDAHLSDKNKTKDKTSFQNPVSLISKSPVKSTNKTNLEHNDLLLSKTVADISQGLNEIMGKEEFKLKMNQLLHNFTVTGHKQGNNIQVQSKSQEVVNIKHENEKKSNKTISKASDITSKITNNEELIVKLKNVESLNKKSNAVKNRVLNKKTTETNSLSGNNSEKFSAKSPTVSVRPGLGIPEYRKTGENITRSGEKNVQRQSVAKIRNSTNIISSSKVKTVISNKSEPTIVENNTSSESKQHVPAKSNSKNNEMGKKVVKPIIQANNVNTKTDMLRKIGKKRPFE